MSIPADEIAVPARVRELATGAAVRAVWRNGVGGTTWRTDDGRHIKIGPHDPEVSMREEAARLRWARPYTTVPPVLVQGEDDHEEWLVTRTVPGTTAVDPRWIADPATAVAAVGRGLRQLHDALPVAQAPWEWSVDARIANAAVRGIVVPAHLHVGPPVDLLVVAHGDACVPNTLLDDDGAPVAHVDLGSLGLADRWADIAVAALSTEWNYGPGWQDALVDAYGVEPDHERIAYYQALWDAT